MTYNTGNAVPSKDPRDLLDNAESFDIRVTSRTERSTPDRLGVPRKTWHGMEMDFAEFLAGSGFELPAIPYLDGQPLTIDRPTQLIAHDGSLYSVAVPADFPIELSGTWAVDEPIMTIRFDQGLRLDLASRDGALSIGWGRSPLSEIVSQVATVGFALSSEAVSPWEFYSLVTDKPDPSDPGTWDWHPALQAAVDTGLSVMIPAGTYYSSKTIRTAHTVSYFRMDTGQAIFGAGVNTKLTRKSALPASTAESAYENEAFFSVHGSNYEISSLYFEDCSIGLYFGQDPRQPVERSHTSFNRINNLWIRNCGTGIMSACSLGHYYNTYSNLHIAQCQVGVKFQAGERWGSSVDNNNRNSFFNVRAARCWVGLWLDNGDTNEFFGYHCEGNIGTPAENRYALPAGLPAAIANYGGVTLPAITTAGGYIVKGGNNNFFGCVTEACDWTLWNQGPNNSYQNCLMREDVSATTAVRCVTPPRNFVTRSTTWLNGGNLAVLTNSNQYAFPGYHAGRMTLSASVGVRNIGAVDMLISPESTQYLRDNLYDVGAIGSGATKSFALWPFVSGEVITSAVFDVSVIGQSVASNVAHATSFKVVVMRNAAGSIIRHYLYDVVSGRATGANTGDSAEPIVPTASVGGASGKDLIISLAAPARVFSSVTASSRVTVSA